MTAEQIRDDELGRLIFKVQSLKERAHTDVELELCYVLVDLLDDLLMNKI